MNTATKITPEIYLQQDIKTAQAVHMQHEMVQTVRYMTKNSGVHFDLSLDCLADGNIDEAVKHYTAGRGTILCYLRALHSLSSVAITLLEQQPEVVEFAQSIEVGNKRVSGEW